MLYNLQQRLFRSNDMRTTSFSKTKQKAMRKTFPSLMFSRIFTPPFFELLSYNLILESWMPIKKLANFILNTRKEHQSKGNEKWIKQRTAPNFSARAEKEWYLPTSFEKNKWIFFWKKKESLEEIFAWLKTSQKQWKLSEITLAAIRCRASY